MSKQDQDNWGILDGLVAAAKMQSGGPTTAGVAFAWPGLTATGDAVFDPETLRSIASDLHSLYSDLQGTDAGTPMDLLSQASQEQNNGFGGTYLPYCPKTVRAVHAYHERVLTSVGHEYTNAVTALQAVADGLQASAQNLDDAENRNIDGITHLDAVNNGTAPPPAGSSPPGGVAPVDRDGSFG